ADRNRSHWSTSKTPSYTKSVSWQHHPLNETDLTQIPKVIEYCKKNPQKNLYTFKNQASNDLPN
ncbi:HdeA/HdeB family chaperone, partial [Escherichia coli]